MNPNRPPSLKRVRLHGFNYFKSRIDSIPTGHKASHAIAEAKRFGSEGRELQFALITIRHRVLATGREMRDGLGFLELESTEHLNEALGVKASTKHVLNMIDTERRAARRQARSGKADAVKKPSMDLTGLREKLANAVNGVVSFGQDANIKTRYMVFKNLMEETKSPECVQVCEWLEGTGEYFMHRARNARSYSSHASQADFAMRCYGAASFIYGKHGFNERELKLQRLLYAQNARLGFA